MAFGTNWEWRGFGRQDDHLYRRILSLPHKFESAQRVEDRYLWVPGATLNVKLRLGDFKIKRLLRSEGNVEQWLEDESENHPFPLEWAVVEDVAKSLGIRLQRSTGTPEGGQVKDGRELLDILGRDAPGIRIVPVEKNRRQFSVPGEESAILEYAEIVSPEDVVSIGVEDPDRDTLLRVMESFGLPGVLTTRNYLEALEVWGHGGSVLG